MVQDNGATIHSAAVSLDAVAETFNSSLAETFNSSLAEIFNSSVDYRTQDSKMADAWPIKNVWDIVAQKKCTNERQVRNAIVGDIEQ